MKILTPNQFKIGYVFGPETLRRVVTSEYAKFLKEAGYADITRNTKLFVAASVLG